MFSTSDPFQCCFCKQTIAPSDEAQGVFITATALAKEKKGQKDIPGQSFYAHGACLTSNWEFEQPWELDVIFDD